jgi:hypothetical protein
MCYRSMRRSCRSLRLSSQTKTIGLLTSRLRFTSFSCSRHLHPQRTPLLRISWISRSFPYFMMYGRLASILVACT